MQSGVASHCNKSCGFKDAITLNLMVNYWKLNVTLHGFKGAIIAVAYTSVL